jgi:hypothetical protein
LAWVTGFGLIMGGAASNGFQSCGSWTWPLIIAGVVVIAVGMAAALMIGRRAARHPMTRDYQD